MITYEGLARVLAVVTGELVKASPRSTGSLAVNMLTVASKELRKLSSQEGGPVERARTGGARGLWQHICGEVGVGAQVTDLPPTTCPRCTHEAGWVKLYVKRR